MKHGIFVFFHFDGRPWGPSGTRGGRAGSGRTRGPSGSRTGVRGPSAGGGQTEARSPGTSHLLLAGHTPTSSPRRRRQTPCPFIDVLKLCFLLKQSEKDPNFKPKNFLLLVTCMHWPVCVGGVWPQWTGSSSLGTSGARMVTWGREPRATWGQHCFGLYVICIYHLFKDTYWNLSNFERRLDFQCALSTVRGLTCSRGRFR